MSQHTITLERWSAMKKSQQILNIASEVSRAYHWRQKNNYTFTNSSIMRALELMDLTINAHTFSKNGLREFLRLREKICEFLTPKGYIGSSSKSEFNTALKVLLFFDKETAGVKIV